MLWGIRKGGPPLSPSDPATAWQSNSPVHIYHTREEITAAREHKLNTIGDTVEPFVLSKEAVVDQNEDEEHVEHVSESESGNK
jgi:hypothetical protein